MSTDYTDKHGFKEKSKGFTQRHKENDQRKIEYIKWKRWFTVDKSLKTIIFID